eukprot:CAMPEP_0170634262 /NCGR_PEP_ID=MMETSP0224-20130122/36496_1 /TAXON_ID=285029 /ORGANISM="Togula jolla, Strain CCCM 725" /LENGTH=44 /DNA_ID= /DNA_START= /DNA_END= /DNA_ORIENTATION=
MPHNRNGKANNNKGKAKAAERGEEVEVGQHTAEHREDMFMVREA